MAPMPEEMPSTGGGTGQVEIFPTLPSNSSEKIIYTFKYKFETIDFDKSTKAFCPSGPICCSATRYFSRDIPDLSISLRNLDKSNLLVFVFIALDKF